uniref:Uncharacterized protein n=1 Tax=Romanomermis culicivorax TaxID=13658 RepID=A0A915JZ36_ROMCU
MYSHYPHRNKSWLDASASCKNDLNYVNRGVKYVSHLVHDEHIFDLWPTLGVDCLMTRSSSLWTAFFWNSTAKDWFRRELANVTRLKRLERSLINADDVIIKKPDVSSLANKYKNVGNSRTRAKTSVLFNPEVRIVSATARKFRQISTLGLAETEDQQFNPDVEIILRLDNNTFEIPIHSGSVAGNSRYTNLFTLLNYSLEVKRKERKKSSIAGRRYACCIEGTTESCKFPSDATHSVNKRGTRAISNGSELLCGAVVVDESTGKLALEARECDQEATGVLCWLERVRRCLTDVTAVDHTSCTLRSRRVNRRVRRP